jgi:Ca2+-binding EF-hand superfamily protein
MDLSELLKSEKDENEEGGFDLKSIEKMLNTIDKLLNNKAIKMLIESYLQNSPKMQIFQQQQNAPSHNENKSKKLLSILDTIIENGGGDITLSQLRELIDKNENIKKMIEQYM